MKRIKIFRKVSHTNLSFSFRICSECLQHKEQKSDGGASENYEKNDINMVRMPVTFFSYQKWVA